MKTTPTRAPAIWRKHKKMKELLGKRGTILSFTQIFAQPKGGIYRTPYYVALIEIPELQKRITVEVCKTSDDMVDYGNEVVLVHRKHKVSEKGLIQYVLKAKVIEK